jgi:hypothetical protein
MVMGDDFERVVSNIMDMMGHPRDEVNGVTPGEQGLKVNLYVLK